MATLEKIRNRAGLLVVVVGLALFAFIIGDFLRSGSTFFHQSKEKIAIVDGEAINIRDYQAKVEEYTEIYKSRSRGETVTEAIQSNIRQSVFDNMVNDLILKEETERIGMTVSKAELSDLIMGDNISPIVQQMPEFVNPQTGVFDKTLLLNFLQQIESDDIPEESRAQVESAKKYWLFWEQNIKRQQVQAKYSNLLSKAINMNSLDAKSAFEDTKVSMDFDYIVQLYNSVPDDQVSVSDSEIEKLYNQRKEAYKQEAGKVISFIAVNIEPSKEDFQETEKIVSDLKPEFTSEANVGDMVNLNSDVKYIDAFRSANELQPELKEFAERANIGDVEGPVLLGNTYRMFKLVAKTVAPDSIQASQLMLPAANTEADQARLNVITDSLIGVLKGGKAFAALAAEASNGQTTGEMGWITEAGLVNAADVKFKDEMFNAPVNQPVVVKSSFGTHLVLVTGKTHPVTKYKIAEIQVAVTPSTKTYNKLYNDLNQYVSKNNNLEKFKSAATESGYVCQNDVVLEQNLMTLVNIPNSRPIIRWAFEHDKGKVSDIFECDDRFVVAALDGDLQKGYRPLKSIQDILKRELLNNKKGEKIIADLKAKNLSSVSQYAEATNSNVQNVKYVTFETANISGIGREPIINAQVLQSKVGSVYGPLKGQSGVYVLSVTEKHTSENQFNLEVQKRSWEASTLQRLMYQFVPALKEKSKIEDNRIRFY